MSLFSRESKPTGKAGKKKNPYHPEVSPAGAPVPAEIELRFPRFTDEESMSESEICVACHGCCSYVTIPIDPPRSRTRIEEYRWYLVHRNVEIFIDHDKSWQLMFKTPCNHLDEKGYCTIYESRPDICREYSADACSRVGSDHTHLFSTPEELLYYLDEKKTKSPVGKKGVKKKTTSGKKTSKKKS